jgi:hypothetical protein
MRSWIGGVVLLALVLLGSRSIARVAERRGGLSMVLATGLPFVLVGAVARHPAVGVFGDEFLANLRPLLEIALGGLGFRIGIEFDVRELDRLPNGTGRVLVAETVAALLLAGGGCLLALVLLDRTTEPRALVAEALILGACASVSGPSGARALELHGLLTTSASRMIRRIALLGNATAVAVLGLVTAIDGVSHGPIRMPIVGGLLLQIGLGVALGLLVLAFVRRLRGDGEDVALALGTIAFAAGCAGYLGFSPLVIGCVAGAVLSSAMRGRGTGEIGQIFHRCERPLLLLCFLIVGALWQPLDRRGLILAPIFFVGRWAGKFVGALFARVHLLPARWTREPPRTSLLPVEALPPPKILGSALLPISALSMAVVVSSAFGAEGPRAASFASAVIVAGLFGEVAFQALARLLARGVRA